MSALNAAFSDVIQGWKFGPFWRLLAWNDLKQRFRRSWLGVGWVMVAFILFLGSKLVIFSFLTKASFPVLALCARLRDISHLTVTSMQIMFFLTPIIWRTEDIGGAAKYVKWNPFTYYLDLIRVPVQTGTWPVESWIVVGCFTGAGLLLALSYFAYARQKIIFWL